VWWLDDRTKRLIENTTNLRGGQDITVDFKHGSPITLTQEQVCVYQLLYRSHCLMVGSQALERLHSVKS
jgi:hypothetical protein